MNDNTTVQIDIALNIDSPNAVAIANNSNVTEQTNALAISGTFPNGSLSQVNSNTTIQFGIALDINSPGAVALATNSDITIQGNLLGTMLYGVGLSLADLGLPGFISDTNGANALATNSDITIQENLLGTMLNGVGLSLADLGLPGFISRTNDAGPNLGKDQHEPNYGGFVMLHSTSHFSDLAPAHPS
jgi:hypothetical protein